MTVALIQGRAMTRPAARAQKTLSSPLGHFRPGRRRARALTRSPMRLSTAGNRVSPAATAQTTTTLAPRPMLRKVFSGTIRSASSETITVPPEKRTALLAVAPATAMASTFSRPPRRSSRKRSTTRSE